MCLKERIPLKKSYKKCSPCHPFLQFYFGLSQSWKGEVVGAKAVKNFQVSHHLHGIYETGISTRDAWSLWQSSRYKYTSPRDTGDCNEEIESIQEFGGLPCKESQTAQGTVDGRNPGPGM